MLEAGLRRAVGYREVDSGDVAEALRAIAAPPDDDSLSSFVEHEATLEQAVEFLIHRSAYQLKEADPHSWVCRVSRAPEDDRVEIQTDEYGAGDPERIHAALFCSMKLALGLDASLRRVHPPASRSNSRHRESHVPVRTASPVAGRDPPVTLHCSR